MQKIKILLAGTVCALLIASCDMYDMENNNAVPPQNTDTNLGDDIKNMGEDISDTAGDAVNNVKNGINDLTGTNNKAK